MSELTVSTVVTTKESEQCLERTKAELAKAVTQHRSIASLIEDEEKDESDNDTPGAPGD